MAVAITTATEAARTRPEQRVVLPGQTPAGEPILSLLVKRTYQIVPGQRCVRAEADRKLIAGDVPYGDPLNSSIQFEADFVPFKPATDVVLIGKAHAPGGQACLSVTVSLSIGKRGKSLRVIGDRTCLYRDKGKAFFTNPLPFTTMDLRYERAYGGVDIFTDPKVPYAYPRNPLGRGFVVGHTPQNVDWLVLPNVEDSNALLTPDRLCIGDFQKWQRQPMPQGFGWYGKSWQPRASLAGVMPGDRPLEQQLRQAYRGLVPAAQRALYDQTQLGAMDFRFFNGASPGLALPDLAGDELVETCQLAPEGDLAFRLPGERPRLGLDIGSGMQEATPALHTVQIRMEDRQVDLVWRGAVPYPGMDWLPSMRKLVVWID